MLYGRRVGQLRSHPRHFFFSFWEVSNSNNNNNNINNTTTTTTITITTTTILGQTASYCEKNLGCTRSWGCTLLSKISEKSPSPYAPAVYNI
jgi:hypothetical protein